MKIVKHEDSHLDHSLTEGHVEFILAMDPWKLSEEEEVAGSIRWHDKGPVYVFTVKMPEELSALPCALYGPACGDEPISEDKVHYATRDGRKGASRLLVTKPPPRTSRLMTIICGPHDGHKAVLFTAHGGPKAEREMFEDDSEVAKEFWGKHALVG